MAKPSTIQMITEEGWNNFFKNAKIEMSPDLPMMKMKVGGVKYEFTDITYLNETAKVLITAIIKEMASTTAYALDDGLGMEFKLPKDADERNLLLALRVVTSLKYKIKKRGAEVNGCLLVSGYEHHMYGDEGDVIAFHLCRDHAAAIWRYAQAHPEELGYIEAAVAIADDSINRMSLAIAEMEKEETNEQS